MVNTHPENSHTKFLHDQDCFCFLKRAVLNFLKRTFDPTVCQTKILTFDLRFSRLVLLNVSSQSSGQSFYTHIGRLITKQANVSSSWPSSQHEELYAGVDMLLLFNMKGKASNRLLIYEKSHLILSLLDEA